MSKPTPEVLSVSHRTAKIEQQNEPDKAKFPTNGNFTNIGDMQELEKLLEPAPSEWEKFRIDLSIFEPDPIPVLTIGDISIGSPGNIISISAKAKSGKSFLCTSIAAAWISGDCLGFHGIPNQDGANILYIDTEQSRPYVRRVAQRIANLANLSPNATPPNLYIYSMKAISKDERLSALRELADLYRPGLIIVDGPRDLIGNFNDPVESTNMLQELQTIVDKYQCLLIGALHENKANTDMRGHAGAEFMNKSETIIGLVKEGPNFRVSAKETRGTPFNDFAFTIDEETILPVLTAVTEKQTRSKKPNPLDAPMEIHIAALNRIFSTKPEFGYAELFMAIKADFAANWGFVGDLIIKRDLLPWYKGTGNMIQQEKNKKYTLVSTV